MLKLVRRSRTAGVYFTIRKKETRERGREKGKQTSRIL
jgi:hypothetical protein